MPMSLAKVRPKIFALKVIWSNDGIARRPAVDGFRNFQFSHDLQEQYGYKPLTEEDVHAGVMMASPNSFEKMSFLNNTVESRPRY